MRRSPASLGALLAFTLVAAACSGSGPASDAGASGATPDLTTPAGPTTTGTNGSSGPTAPVGPALVPEILRFETPLVGGGALQGSELAGAPVALWFWAPW
jgi:hypothetical protein